jgi:Protein of unknown function (DUF3099)
MPRPESWSRYPPQWQYRKRSAGRRDAVVRDRKPPTVLITDAPEDQEKELRRREVRYVAMMLIRAACVIGAAILATTRPPLWGLWVGLCLVAMLVLPWCAVILANDRPAKNRRPQRPTPPVSVQPAIPSPRDDRVIDADL